ncbi:hypothetical protein [Cupriavidus sp. TMH.W2]|uniref:hypothetical protein n=1 Tax=Cupriavidus sp. TMH.W2 TaxID=3434465 RepID=UPI003D76F19F
MNLLLVGSTGLVGSHALEQALADPCVNSVVAPGRRALTYVRPGLTGGQRAEFRFGERAMVTALTLLGPVAPRRWRLNPASRIAEALLASAKGAAPGIHVVTSDRLT